VTEIGSLFFLQALDKYCSSSDGVLRGTYHSIRYRRRENRYRFHNHLEERSQQWVGFMYHSSRNWSRMTLNAPKPLEAFRTCLPQSFVVKL
jgi:hypothetical protein